MNSKTGFRFWGVASSIELRKTRTAWASDTVEVRRIAEKVKAVVTNDAGMDLYAVTGDGVTDLFSLKRSYFHPENVVRASEYATLNLAIAGANSANKKLLIDSNITATGVGVLNVNVEVEIVNGAIITMPTVVRTDDGTTPVIGTVTDNYLQINFYKFFSAKGTCFAGDGLPFFLGQSVTEIRAEWWGITTTTNTSPVRIANRLAIQKAVKSVTLIVGTNVNATSIVRLPQGTIYIDKPIVAMATFLDSDPFLSGRRYTVNQNRVCNIKIIGNEPIKHTSTKGSATSIVYTGSWGAPFIYQGCRNSELGNIHFTGSNDFSTRDSEWNVNNVSDDYIKCALRPDDFHSYSKVNNAWLANNVIWSRYQPYAALITDPFNTSSSNIQAGFAIAKIAGSNIDLYYNDNAVSTQNTFGVDIYSCHCTKFVSFICNTLVDNLGDTFRYNNIMIQDQPIGISTCQAQSRNCYVENFMVYSGVWSAFDISLHGGATGVCPEVLSMNAAGGLKYLLFNPSIARGNVKMNNVYSEALYAIFGDSTPGSEFIELETQNFAKSITDSTLKFMSREYVTSGTTRYLPRPKIVSGFSLNNSFIGHYGDSDKNINVYNSCVVGGTAFGQELDNLNPLDRGWFKRVTQTPTMSNGSRNPVLRPLSWGGAEVVTMYPTANYIEIDISSYGGADISSRYPVGSVIYVCKTEGSKDCIGLIRSVSSTTIRVTNISIFDMNKMLLGATANQQTGCEFFVLANAKSATPFRATRTATRQITIQGYLASVVSPVAVAVNYPINIGDTIYYVDSIAGSVITLNTDVVITNEWCYPVFSPNSTELNDLVPASDLFAKNGFYRKNSTYKVFDATGKDAYQIAECVKSGDFVVNTAGYTKKADFLIYSSEKKELLFFVNGATTTGSGTGGKMVKIPFNLFGNTAVRPDKLGIPSKYIPIGYIYKNIELGIFQVFNGNYWSTTAQFGALDVVLGYTNTKLYLDSSDTTTTALEEGVFSYFDKKSEGLSKATQSNASLQPALGGSQNTLTFSLNDKLDMNQNVEFSTRNFSVSFVIEGRWSADRQVFGVDADYGQSFQVFLRNTLIRIKLGASFQFEFTGLTAENTTLKVVTVVGYNDGTPRLKLRINKVDHGTIHTNTWSSGLMAITNIGDSKITASKGYDGRFGSVVVHNNTPTTEVLEAIEDQLISKHLIV
jgi:hypothetical protein